MLMIRKWKVKFMRRGWDPPYPFGKTHEIVETSSGWRPSRQSSAPELSLPGTKSRLPLSRRPLKESPCRRERRVGRKDCGLSPNDRSARKSMSIEIELSQLVAQRQESPGGGPMCYTGIGSRQTPESILGCMRDLGKKTGPAKLDPSKRWCIGS